MIWLRVLPEFVTVGISQPFSWNIVKNYSCWLLILYYFCNSRFWSQIIYDDETLDVILKFLQNAPPYYVLQEFPQDDEMWTSFQNTHYLVFLVINRLATYSESEVSKIYSEKWNLRTSDTVFKSETLLKVINTFPE